MNHVITWFEALQAFLAVIFFLISSVIAGFLITKKYLPGPYTLVKLFLTLVAGMTMLVSIFAIWKTTGKTILLPVPILLIAGFYFIKSDGNINKDEKQSPVNWQLYVPFIIGLCALYFVFFLQVYLGGDKDSFSYPGVDNLFYARVIDYLNVYGVENSLGDFFYPYEIGVKPYHYFDLWIAALISQTMGVNSVNALVLCSYTVFCVLTSVGVMALLQTFFKSLLTIHLLLISAFTLLFSGFAFLFPHFILNADVFDLSIANYPKVALAAVFILAMLLLAKKTLWNSFLAFGSIISLLFINVLPGVTVASTLCVVIYIMIGKEAPFKKVVPGILLSIASLIFIPLFYHFFSIKLNNTSATNVNYFEAVSSLADLKNLKTAVNIFIGGNFQFFILLPFIILGAIIFIRNGGIKPKGFEIISRYKVQVVLFIFPISGLISWALLFNVSDNSVQFFHNLLIPFCGIFIAMTLGYCIQAGKYFKYIAVSLILIMAMLNYDYGSHVVTITNKEWRNLKAFVKTPQNLMANYRGDKDFNTTFSMYVMVYQPLDILYYLLPNYNNTCITKVKVVGANNYTRQIEAL